jgi:hypothetical protein
MQDHAVDALLQAIEHATRELLDGVVLHPPQQHDALLQRETRATRTRTKHPEHTA